MSVLLVRAILGRDSAQEKKECDFLVVSLALDYLRVLLAKKLNNFFFFFGISVCSPSLAF
jgi:hypothetical protein